ncbi:glycoside hydrolase family 97 protein [Dysgonomonas sp. ZJ279]|uniref:glycoside hydrolase family 97 protein n=1 Tax=Dysgonomonas sp. ZJ279 TaxID=2709796 RepID=UPI003977C90B
MMKFKTVIFSAFLLLGMTVNAQKNVSLSSPDGKLKTNIEVGDAIKYSITHNGDKIIEPSAISMTLVGGKSFGIKSKLSKVSNNSNKGVIPSPLYKKSQVTDNYNEVTLAFKENFKLVFRAYNEGVAYRFIATEKAPFVVEKEDANFNFADDKMAYIPYVRDRGTIEQQFFNSFENIYAVKKLSQWEPDRLAFLPILIDAPNGKKVCITEADLMSYPGMYLIKDNASNGLNGVFAPYPKKIEQGGHNMLQGLVKSSEPYIAKCEANTSFPWRVITVSEKDADLLNNDMVYRLATPSQVADISWIKPGKVAWDWWNDWNLFDVDFKAGINNETYKYYIDFASKHNIEYVILDEGWAVNLEADLFKVIPEIDLKELVAYADQRNVKLILWAGYLAFDKDIEGICKHYSEMGIKGFKVDFMDRDDQPMVDFHRRSAEIAAKYHIMLDFHGTYKPTGLHRTYPNVINYEGVNGLEQLKWASDTLDQVTYDVTMPFIRMLAGPIDYTQGAMRNASRGNFRPVNSEAMSQGTRCHQLAEYIIFESPLNMLCDNPSNYMREKECTEFIAVVPTVWDNTVALDSEIGKYVSIARQKGDDWYVGVLNNWDDRTLTLDLSFLDGNGYKAEIFKDGVNANRAARDYKREVIDLPANKKLDVKLASGGGYVVKISK